MAESQIRHVFFSLDYYYRTFISSISGDIGNWTFECVVETYIKQLILSKDYAIKENIKHLWCKYKYTCMAHILKFNVHFKSIIMWFLICKW